MDWWDSVKSMFRGPASSSETLVQSALGPAASTSQTSSMFGTQAETPGYTGTGARRIGKSRKAGKKKTRRSRKH